MQLVVPEPAQQVQLAAVIPGVQCTTGGRCDKAATVVSLVVGRCAFVAVFLLIGGSLFFFFFCICLIARTQGRLQGWVLEAFEGGQLIIAYGLLRILGDTIAVMVHTSLAEIRNAGVDAGKQAHGLGIGFAQAEQHHTKNLAVVQ